MWSSLGISGLQGGNPPRLTHWLFVCGHFHNLIQQGGTMSDVTNPGGRIRSFVERIENIDSELAELNEQKKEVFAEAKGEGFDVKILKEIIKLRKQDQDDRDERESLLDLYMRAMETAPAEKPPKRPEANEETGYLPGIPRPLARLPPPFLAP